MTSQLCSLCNLEGCFPESEWCIVTCTKNRIADLIKNCQSKPANEAIQTLRIEILSYQKYFDEYLQHAKFAFKKYEKVVDEYNLLLQDKNGIETEETKRNKESERYIKEAVYEDYVYKCRIAMVYNDSLTELWKAYDLIDVKL